MGKEDSERRQRSTGQRGLIRERESNLLQEIKFCFSKSDSQKVALELLRVGIGMGLIKIHILRSLLKSSGLKFL